MLPPVPAVILSVPGREGDPDELSVVWSFVINGEPPQIGVAIADEHIAQKLVEAHKRFVLNVPVASIVEKFDRIDMNSSRVADKFELSGLTRGEAASIDAPTVEECPIHLECNVFDARRVEPMRMVFFARVVATTVTAGVVDANERLIVEDVPFFGMTAGSGEFYTMGEAVGNIGQTVGRTDIRY